MYTWKLLYMFRVVPLPIIRSAYNCIYSIWYLSHCYCYLPLSWKSWNPQHTQTGSNSSTIVAVWQIPDAVDTAVCAPDDGWRYHPKHLEQFPDKINCVTLHLVGYILEYSYNARTHERSKLHSSKHKRARQACHVPDSCSTSITETDRHYRGFNLTHLSN